MERVDTRKPRGWMSAWTVAGLMFAAAVIATALTDEMAWGPADFLIFAAMLAAAAAAYEFAAKRLRTSSSRVAAGAIVVIAVMLVWAELAVGIFD